MLRQFRPLPLFALVLVSAIIVACSSSDLTVTPKLSPAGTPPSMVRIKATDSTMAVTDISYSDTAAVLRRITPLADDVTVSALIGPAGGELDIAAAGATLEIPAGALAVPTQITVTALKGYNVAYEFGPHGTVFAQPVKIRQDLRTTVVSLNPALLRGLHGAYYDSSLDSSYIDPGHLLAHVKENELGYPQMKGTQLQFYVGHFSGYIIAMGSW